MNKLSTVRSFIREVYQVWVSERPNQLAAALAYFGVFSFAAVIYFAYRVASIFINETAAADRLYARIENRLGTELATFIQDSVAAIASTNTGGSWIISAVSLISLLFAAMGFFLQIKYALNRIWDIPPTPAGQKFAFLRQQFFAFIALISLGLLVILATVVNLAFTWFGSVMQAYVGQGKLLPILNALALLGLVVLALAFTYKVLPDERLVWRDVWPGSIAATIGMALGGLVIGLYFSLGGVHSAFEAAGAFAVLMIMIYFFAQIFLFGAVITRVYAYKYGSKHMGSSAP
jgi:membrane protein